MMRVAEEYRREGGGDRKSTSVSSGGSRAPEAPRGLIKMGSRDIEHAAP